MAANPLQDPFGLEASGIPPEMAAQYRGLTREQAIAEALMKQGLAPGGGAINAGKFLVAPSPLEGVSKIMQVLAGRYMQGQNDTKLAELGGKFQQSQAKEMADYLRSRDTPAKPEITLPEDQAGPVREAIPAVPGGNAATADITGLASGNPRVAALAKILQAQTQKEQEAAKLEEGRMVRHRTPSGSAVLGETGTQARYDSVSANVKAQIDAAMKRLETVPAGTAAQIAAMKDLRDAMKKFYENSTAVSATKVFDETGIRPPGLPPSVGVTAPPAPAPALPPDGAQTPAAAQAGQQKPTIPALSPAQVPPAVQQLRDRDRLTILLDERTRTTDPAALANLDKEIAAMQGKSALPGKDQRALEVAREKARIDALAAEGKAAGTVQGKARGTAALNLPQVEAQVSTGIKLIDDLVAHPGKKYAVGLAANVPTYLIKGTPGADFKARLDQIGGQQFLAAYEALKGGGSITDIEGKKATAAISRMSQATSIAEFDKAAQEYKEVLNAGLLRMKQRASGGASQQPASPQSGPVIDWNSLPK